MHSEESAHHAALFDQAIHHAPNQVARNRKTDSLVTAAAAQDRCVDPNQSPFCVHQCATGITGINRRIRLDEILIIEAHVSTAHRAHHAHRDGLADAERISNRQHQVAHLDVIAVRELHDWQVLRVNLQHRYVCLWIFAHNFGYELPSVTERDFDFVRVIYDVIVRQNVSVFAYYYTGSQPSLLGKLRFYVAVTISAISPVELIAEKSTKEWFVKRLRGIKRSILGRRTDENIHHARCDFLHHRRKARGQFCLSFQRTLVHFDFRRFRLAGSLSMGQWTEAQCHCAHSESAA